MNRCPACKETLKATKLSCEGCSIQFEGDFHLPRLARLSREHQIFIEAFVLSGGHLKDLSQTLDISYPTLRKRLDDLIKATQALQHSDERHIESIMENIESGNMSAEEGLRHIKEINGEL